MIQNKKIFFRDMAVMLMLVSGATLTGILFRTIGLQQTNVVVVYLLSVLITSRFTHGYTEGVLASILSMLAFNWFFAEPYYTLKVNDLTYIITFVIMTLSAILTSALTTKFKKAAKEARENEAQSNALYQMTNHLTDAKSIEEIESILLYTIRKILDCCAACAVFDEKGHMKNAFLQQKEDGTQIHREFSDMDEFQWNVENLQAMYSIGSEFYDWPIYGKNIILGMVRIPAGTASEMTENQEHLLLSIIESSSLAIERLRSFEQEAKTREEAEKERYRGNLLRAISHDIRTPLSGIMGSSEILLQMLPENEVPYNLASDIYDDAGWLHSLVENILSLTRLKDGNTSLEKEKEALEEIIGAAIRTMKKRAPQREITVDMPDTFLMIPMNAALIHQVLVNLLDNAVKHSPDDTEISIFVSLSEEKHQVQVFVRDRGTGIPPEEADRIFEMFYTTRGKCVDSKRGIGLGLSICKSIIEAHGGQLYGKNRQDTQGAEFSFTLPTEE